MCATYFNQPDMLRSLGLRTAFPYKAGADFFYDQVLRERLSESRSLGLPELSPLCKKTLHRKISLRVAQTRWRHPFRNGDGVRGNAPSSLQRYKQDTRQRLNGYSATASKNEEISDCKAIFPKRITESRIKKASSALSHIYLDNVKRDTLKALTIGTTAQRTYP